MDRELLLQTLKRQYDSTYSMLKKAVELCPEDLWLDRDEEAPFWQQTLHTAMSMHGCLRDSLPDFDHEIHRRLAADVPAEASFQDRMMVGIRMMVRDFQPSHTVTRDEMSDYVSALWARTGDALERDLDRGLESSHPQVWAGPSLLEKHIYYLRHAQHHIGRLNSMLYRKAGVNNPWVVIDRPAFAPEDYKGITTVGET